ncbi:proteophosphoglycan ppg4 [Rhodotorula toruloides]|uniref:Proteophosphoglycan ppg4 n=1 Tax=Rhodotorula toruloides TaxID=5286 RepID=A0A511KGU0_RHOTO|nr:proteophosphoglycan ppg4 [Rhodotorula toruloides]
MLIPPSSPEQEHNIKANGKTDALVAALAQKLGLKDAAEAPEAQLSTSEDKAASKAATMSAKALRDAATPAKGAPQIVYATSPGTKATVAILVTTVKELQSQLALTQATPSSPKISRSHVVQLIDSSIAAHRDEMQTELEQRFDASREQHVALQNDVNAIGTRLDSYGTTVGEVRSSLDDQKQTLQGSIDVLRRDLMSRLDTLAQAQPAPPAGPAKSPVAEPRQRQITFASPTLSDAPPTETLISFSSPVAFSSGTDITPRRRPSVTSRKATPFRITTPAADAADSPASALPSHMIAAAASAARRNPRSTPGPEPQSPVGPAPPPSLGKRSRDENVSDLSIEVEAVVAAAELREPNTSPDFLSGFFTAPTSAKKEDGHSRKRLRIVEPEEEDGEDEVVDSFGQQTKDIQALTTETEGDDESDEEEVREYLVKTKTGDSPSPVKRRSSIHDPDFFAGLAPSPAARRSRSGGVNENVGSLASPGPGTTATGRSPLPTLSLAFPLVSPGSKSLSFKSFGTPNTTKTSSSSLFAASDKANRSPAPVSLFGSASQSRPRARSSTLSLSARKGRPASLAAPPTPPAPRTLFGTERFDFDEEAGEVEEGSRFGEGVFEGEAVSVGGSPVKGWAAFAA